jgi:hypothetical protein
VPRPLEFRQKRRNISGLAKQGVQVGFETIGDGAVFSTGSITFCGSLSHNNYENNVSLMLENVSRRFRA